MSQDTNLTSLIINKMTKAQYDALTTKNANELYFVTDNSGITAGTGLSLNGYIINHSNSVAAATAGTSSATSGSTLAVPYIVYDAQGHITGSGTHTHTITGFTTTSDVNGLISTAIGGINSFNVEVVNELPSSDIDEHTIYFVSNSGSGADIYDEYMYINNGWEKIGNTQVDLSGYVPTSRTINGKALSANISLTASDVGALPSSTTYVSSFNGDTGAITYTAPVTSVNGNTGAVTTTDEKLITNALSQDSNQTGYTMILGQKNATASIKYYDPGLDYANRNDEHTARLTIGVSGTDDSRRQGQVAFYNQNKYCILRNSSTTNSGYYINLPDSGGTLALTTAIPSASIATPAMDGTASAGSSTSWAKGDHVHPTDTSRQAKITASGILKGDGSGGVTAATAGTDYQAAGNYKTTQTAKTDPTAGSTGATSFIATITQNANGEITATKEPVTFPVTSVNGQTGAVTLTIPDADDHKWNNVSLNKTNENTSADAYIPYLSSATSTEAKLIQALDLATTANTLVKRTSSGYIVAATPSANDNSTKVATTAYVDSAMTTKPTIIVSSTQPSSANSGDVWFKIS